MLELRHVLAHFGAGLDNVPIAAAQLGSVPRLGSVFLSPIPVAWSILPYGFVRQAH